ncbi:helix-turn-helix transcriptional regulator [Thiorhodococcus minor]|uniref:Helix-turn-helix domain-containing protein n=1 Tax=Thiorhodococcus minor TaxID=57489 RepID=A0A6M0JU05_9GAMM|nr:helix-turn-helix domain-containing protein [Thiorhodococcus minor]NEV60411.1 helix-turn-helix domain-containing protein [Thiorhodococcus minor]
MPLTIKGLTYYTAADVAERVEVSRQTLWRWRQDGKIPLGHKYRNRHVVFTPAELKQIELFADRIEPIAPSDRLQSDLFQDS